MRIRGQVGVGLRGGEKALPHVRTVLEQEKSQLEERLQQALNTMQRLEAELEAFQRSCLLQLARSSWVGRVLRSSTGSVEVSPARPALLPPGPSPALLGLPLDGQRVPSRLVLLPGGPGLPGKPVPPGPWYRAGRTPLVHTANVYLRCW